MKSGLLIFPLLLYGFSCCYGSDLGTDSLKNIIKNTFNDSLKTEVFLELAKKTIKNQDKAMAYIDSAMRFSEERNDTLQVATALLIKGYVYYVHSDFANAKVNYSKSIQFANKLSKIEEVYIKACGNYGVVFFITGAFDSAHYYFDKSYHLAKQINNKEFISDALQRLGVLNYNFGEIDSAMKYYNSALAIYKELEDRKGISIIYNSLGNVYSKQNNLTKSIECHFNSLKIREELNDVEGMIDSYTNIGLLYEEQGHYYEALENLYKSLKLSREVKNKYKEAMALNNVGIAYKNLPDKDFDKLHQNPMNRFSITYGYYQKSLRKRKEIGDQMGIAASCNNLGDLYTTLYESHDTIINEFSTAVYGKAYATKTKLKNIFIDSALYYQKNALGIQEGAGKTLDMTYSINGIAAVYKEKGEYQKAIDHYTRAYELSENIGFNRQLRGASKGLYLCYQALGNYKETAYWLEKLLAHRADIYDEEKQKEIGKLEADFEYQRKLYADSIRNEEMQKRKDLQIQAQNEQIVFEKKQRYYLYSGFSLLILFTGLMYNRFIVIRKQKKTIEQQKKEVEKQKDAADRHRIIVEEKNKEIIDSITYAKRLQNAILPQPKIVKEYLNESFILYKPKDIVAGDFYFMETIEEKDKTLIYYAAADCTGHGVPGAMVSVVGANGLKRCIKEFGLREPGKILDQLSAIVTEAFEKSEEQINDGMDIALCCMEIDKENNQTLKFSGANNPLWMINPQRKNWPEPAIPFKEGGGAEMKATKQPIGYYENRQPFNTVEINLQKGDALYTFSDGFADQFGGENAGGKKFKSANFKKLLVECYPIHMEDQKNKINQVFEDWRGQIAQIDDVCVIGVRV